MARDWLNHALAHEFPQYFETMRALRVSAPRFAKLFTEYDEDDHAIKKYEQGLAVISDEALEVLKKKRLKTKDEIYQRLLRD